MESSYVLKWLVEEKVFFLPLVFGITIVEDGISELMEEFPSLWEGDDVENKENDKLYHWEIFAVALKKLFIKKNKVWTQKGEEKIIKKFKNEKETNAKVKAFVDKYLLSWTLGEPQMETNYFDSANFTLIPSEGWIIVGRYGHWKNKKIVDLFSKLFGELDKDWRWGYQWGDNVIDYRSGIEIYEDSYYNIFKSKPELLKWITETASECYDTSPGNIKSYGNYSIQEVDGAGQHWQDISVRRCLFRLQTWFKGDHLVEIRGMDSEGYRLNPSQIPFHLPEMIIDPRQFGWWSRDSVEDFSMSNYIVQAKEELVIQFLNEKLPSEDALIIAMYAAHPSIIPAIHNLFTKNLNEREILFVARAFTQPKMPLSTHWESFYNTISNNKDDLKTAYSACLKKPYLVDKLIYNNPKTTKIQLGDFEKDASIEPVLLKEEMLFVLKAISLDPNARRIRSMAINILNNLKKK